MNFVELRFFGTLEMPLVAGAGFERVASDGPKVAVVNERFVERFGLGDGRRRQALSTLGATAETFDIEIVGVVRDAKYSEVKADPPPQVFMPREQAPFLGEMSFYLRSSLGWPELRAAVGQVARAPDANLPLMDFRTVTRASAREHFPRPFHEHAGRGARRHGDGARRASAFTVCSLTASCSGCARSGCASRSAPRRGTCAAWCLKQVALDGRRRHRRSA